MAPTVPRGRSRAGNAGRGSCFSGDHAEGTHCVGQGRSRAERQRMCLYVTLPVQGGLFLNPKSRQQLAFLQGPGGSILPCGLPWLRQRPVRLSAVFGSAEARLGASVGGEAPLQAVPFSPCLAGFLCQAVFPSARAPAEVTAGLGAAGGPALEIQRFLRHERLPKANNRGCRLLSLPGADSCRHWRRHGAPRCCGSSSARGTASGWSCPRPRCSDRHECSLRAACPQILLGEGAFP